MRIAPFSAGHIAALGRGAEAWTVDYITNAAALEGGLAFTGMVEGRPVACGGVVEVWRGRYIAWFYAGSDAKQHWKHIHRAVKKFLADLDADRVEADIDCDFAGAHRWIQSLGFRMEVERRRKFFPDGRDAALYARVKE